MFASSHVQTNKRIFNIILLITFNKLSLILGTTNGLIELQAIQDSCLGKLEFADNLVIPGQHFLRRTQWLPNLTEHLFSVISTSALMIVNPATMSEVERYPFKNDILWSDWNPYEASLIAVCGTESMMSLVDLRAGNSLQTMILSCPSGIKKHTANRCCWSKLNSRILLAGDNDGFVHKYDIRNNMKPLFVAGGELGEINCMNFTQDENSLITTHGNRNRIVRWTTNESSSTKTLVPDTYAFKLEPKGVNSGDTNKRGAAGAEDSASPLIRFIRGRRRRNDDPASQANKFKTFLGSQFYMSSRHLYCPAHELLYNDLNDFNIYDLKTGYRIKSLRTDPSFVQGAFCVTGLMPESMVIYTGGMDKLRVWSFDELNRLKQEKLSSQYHTSNWNSDSDEPE